MTQTIPNIMFLMYNADRINIGFLDNAKSFVSSTYTGPMDTETIKDAIPRRADAIAVYATPYYQQAIDAAVDSGKPVILLNPNGTKPEYEHLFAVNTPFNRPITKPEQRKVLTSFESKVKKHHDELTSGRNRNNLRY